MSNGGESVKKVFLIALILCVVCSIVVSVSAVLLKPIQVVNKQAFLKRNILEAARMYEEGQSIEEQFSRFTPRVVDLDTGKFTDAVDPETYDMDAALRDPTQVHDVPDEEDIAKIGRRTQYAKIYTLEEGGEISMVILPIRGYGLWGQLYGYLALKADGNTIVGLSYYDHKETPGLGGEVDNPKWKAQWAGKKIYDEDNNVAIEVMKGSVDPEDRNAVYRVDGLSGATLTSRGVQFMFEYWMGENGFGPFLSNLRQGEA